VNLSPRQMLLPAAVLAVALAGCGSATNNAAPPTTPTASTSTSLTPQPSPTPAPTPVVTGGDVALIVNGHKIPMSHYRLLLNLAAKQVAASPAGARAGLLQAASQTRQQLIAEEVLREWASAHGIVVTNADIQQQEAKDEKAAGSAALFKQRLAAAGLTMAQYHILVQPSLLGQKVAARKFPLKIAPQPVANVRHILIATALQGKVYHTNAKAKALAEQLLSQIKRGADFATLAKKYSNDPGSARNGGNLGQVRPGEMVPSFNKAVFSIPLHHPTIVHSIYGYHIVEVLSRGTAPESKAQAQQTQQGEFGAWLQAQMKKAKVKTLARVKS